MVLRARKLLLHLRHLHQVARVHDARELGHEGDVLGHVARHLAELGVVLDEGLHVGDRVDLAVRVRLVLVLVDHRLHVGAKVAKVEEHVLRVERVGVGGEDDLAELVLHSGHLAHVYARVGDAHQLVHHRLVGPLVEERRNGILAPVDDEQQRRHLLVAEGEELRLALDRARHLLRDLLRQLRVRLVPDRRAQLEREQQPDESRVHAIEEQLVEARAAQADDGWHVEREELGIDGEVVTVHLLHLLHHLMLVRLCELVDHTLACNPSEEDVVLAIPCVAQRGADAANVLGGRADEVDRLQVWHPVRMRGVQRVD
mmetsp:Transcript_21447/g.55202  ORF Transcript_21447/g.55202 Transcript_21447/m.55202 type:complete len:314 (-) Transcript_21447:240-1181(-)